MCNFKEGLDSSDRRKKGLTSYYHIVKVRLRCCACRTRAAKLKPSGLQATPRSERNARMPRRQGHVQGTERRRNLTISVCDLKTSSKKTDRKDDTRGHSSGSRSSNLIYD